MNHVAMAIISIGPARDRNRDHFFFFSQSEKCKISLRRQRVIVLSIEVLGTGKIKSLKALVWHLSREPSMELIIKKNNPDEKSQRTNKRKDELILG